MELVLQVACGASPAVKRFFVAMYLDPFLSKPLQVWQFYVHAMQRVDVACVEGQTSRFTLILRFIQKLYYPSFQKTDFCINFVLQRHSRVTIGSVFFIASTRNAAASG